MSLSESLKKAKARFNPSQSTLQVRLRIICIVDRRFETCKDEPQPVRRALPHVVCGVSGAA